MTINQHEFPYSQRDITCLYGFMPTAYNGHYTFED